MRRRNGNSCDLNGEDRRAKHLFATLYNRQTGNRSGGRNLANDESSQSAEPKNDCLQVESLEDIPMCFKECRPTGCSLANS